MKKSTIEILNSYIEKNHIVNQLREQIETAVEKLALCYENGGKLLVCGNGGSCADADHIVGELLKGFTKKRQLNGVDKEKYRLIDCEATALAERLQGSLPAINLCAHSSLVTAVINDIGGEEIFAQQVVGYGKQGDVFLGISTSGNSKDVINAAYVAKVQGVYTIALSGRDGGKMKDIFDLSIIVPKEVTSDIQDCHSVIYHAICEMVENEFFEE